MGEESLATIHRQASLVQKVTIEIRLPLNSLRVGLPYTHVKYAAVPPNASAADQPRQEHSDSVGHYSAPLIRTVKFTLSLRK